MKPPLRDTLGVIGTKLRGATKRMGSEGLIDCQGFWLVDEWRVAFERGWRPGWPNCRPIPSRDHPEEHPRDDRHGERSLLIDPDHDALTRLVRGYHQRGAKVGQQGSSPRGF